MLPASLTSNWQYDQNSEAVAVMMGNRTHNSDEYVSASDYELTAYPARVHCEYLRMIVVLIKEEIRL
jgi:hypothetical protein